jgi:hypothetical protein
LHTAFQWYITSAAEKSPLNNQRINHVNQYQAYSIISDKIQSQVVKQNMLLHMMSSGSKVKAYISCLCCLKNNGSSRSKISGGKYSPLVRPLGVTTLADFHRKTHFNCMRTSDFKKRIITEESKMNFSEESRMNFSSKVGLFKIQYEKNTY